LLPLPRQTLIESLISRFDFESAGTCVICSNDHIRQLIHRVRTIKPRHLTVGFLEDGIPLGTAGCLKACESRTQSDTIMLAGGAVWLEDDPRWMVEEHRRQGNALTVFCTRHAGWAGSGLQNHLRPAGLFCCERSVLEHIRPTGFQDLKEQLVPALHRAGLRVGAVPLRADTCEVSDQATYMRILSHILSDERFALDGFTRVAPDIWCGRDVRIAPKARVVGPALLGHGCRIDDGSVIVGPAILGDGCHVGRDAWLIRVVAPERLRVRPGVSLTDRVLPKAAAPGAGVGGRGYGVGGIKPQTPYTKPQSARAPSRLAATPGVATGALLLGTFIWAFWSTIGDLWTFFARNTDYSAGQLVPAAALYMVVTRRSRLSSVSARFWWPGAALFALGLAANCFGRYYRYSSAENLGVVTCAVGIISSIAGYQICRRLWYPLLFLFLMVPLPHTIHGAVMLPLQGMSAQVATTVLETIGIPAVRSGHVLEVAGHQIAVAEACSGLRMALAFLIVTGVIAFVVDRPRWQRIAVLLSSVPIALACNVVRVVFSAYLFSIGQEWLAQGAFHDGAGLIMMPAAVGFVFFEFWLLSNLVVPSSAVAAIVEVCDDRVQRPPVVYSG
jgi:exosortase